MRSPATIRQALNDAAGGVTTGSTRTRRTPGSRRRRACSTRPTPSRSRTPCRRTHRTKTLDLGGLELAPRAGLEPFERQRAVAAAVEPLHAVADRLEHALHLAVAPFVEHRARCARRRSAAPPPGSSGRRRARRLHAAARGRRRSAATSIRPRRPCRPRSADARAGARARRRSSAASAPVVSASSRPTGTTRAGCATRSTTVGRPCGSRAVVTTPAGLFSRT